MTVGSVGPWIMDTFPFNFFFCLKRTMTQIFKITVLLLTVDLATAVGCGGGMTVGSVGPWIMDERVWGISGSWEEGCLACGKHLESNGQLQLGWYCEKPCDDVADSKSWGTMCPAEKRQGPSAN